LRDGFTFEDQLSHLLDFVESSRAIFAPKLLPSSENDIEPLVAERFGEAPELEKIIQLNPGAQLKLESIEHQSWYVVTSEPCLVSELRLLPWPESEEADVLHFGVFAGGGVERAYLGIEGIPPELRLESSFVVRGWLVAHWLEGFGRTLSLGVLFLALVEDLRSSRQIVRHLKVYGNSIEVSTPSPRNLQSVISATDLAVATSVPIAPETSLELLTRALPRLIAMGAPQADSKSMLKQLKWELSRLGFWGILRVVWRTLARGRT
jgi:hypothetical protein